MRLKSRILPLLTAAALSAPLLGAVSSCGDDGQNPQQQKVSKRVRDKKAYALGGEHARKLLEYADDEGRVQDGLLDTRARISNINAKLGAQSAADYERGFTDYVRKNNDSLARIIF